MAERERPGARRPRRAGRRRALEPATLLAALALCLGCGGRQPLAGVILISIDTLRPDHLGCYGYDQPTSPALDRLAAEGARFAAVHSSTTWTLPAHVSLLTGLPDDLHGVVLDPVPLDPRHALLQESFSRAGYATAGFFGGPYLHPCFGFGRGFDRYENCGVPQAERLAAADAAAAELLALEQAAHRIRTAPAIQERAEQFLRSRDGRPFFLFLHHWDTHYDYNAPREFVELFAPNYRGGLAMEGFLTNPAIHAGMSAEDHRYLLACYDAEIRWVDHHVGRLLELLDELDLLDRTLVVVTSDHGEQFFEHGQKGHRVDLHEESLRVPLILRGPGVRRGLVIEEGVRLFDVMPTVLALAGLPPVAEAFGVDLSPLLRGAAGAEFNDLPLIAELTEPLRGDTGETAADAYYKHVAVGHGRYKLMEAGARRLDPERPLDFDGAALGEPKRALFDIAADRGETRDLSAADPAALAAARRRLAEVTGELARRRAGGTAPGTPLELDPEVKRMLGELGYVGAGGARRAPR